jgi:DNA-binding LytR/AlgR family response regulator
VQERIRYAQPVLNTEVLLQQLAAKLERRAAAAPLRWIRASVGQTVSLIAVSDIDYLRAEEKYTSVAWRDEANEPREAVIRTPLKELITQLDAEQFAQVHRSVVVNLSSIARIVRGPNETADIHLKGRDEILPVSRSYLHLFRQM